MKKQFEEHNKYSIYFIYLDLCKCCLSNHYIAGLLCFKVAETYMPLKTVNIYKLRGCYSKLSSSGKFCYDSLIYCGGFLLPISRHSAILPKEEIILNLPKAVCVTSEYWILFKDLGLNIFVPEKQFENMRL